MQLFTPEKRDTLAFHIMTKEIYPHSVLISQFNPSKQVGMKPLCQCDTCSENYVISNAIVACFAIKSGAKLW